MKNFKKSEFVRCNFEVLPYYHIVTDNDTIEAERFNPNSLEPDVFDYPCSLNYVGSTTLTLCYENKAIFQIEYDTSESKDHAILLAEFDDEDNRGYGDYTSETDIERILVNTYPSDPLVWLYESKDIQDNHLVKDEFTFRDLFKTILDCSGNKIIFARYLDI
jgi:hypothetical protein